MDNDSDSKLSNPHSRSSSATGKYAILDNVRQGTVRHKNVRPNSDKSKSFTQVEVSVEQQVVEQKPGGLKPETGRSKPHRLAVRLSDKEHEHVVRQAEKACLTLSQYFRASILGAEYVSNTSNISAIDPVKRELLQNIAKELGRQGTNLNQIARHLNGGTASPEEGDSMLAIIARPLLQAYQAVRKALVEGQDYQ